MSGEYADEHPHSENERISRREHELIAMLERLDKLEKQVDWLMENILYHGKTLSNVMEDNPERWLK